jgi:ferric-dicitrate binding protein FerR (iron transport regulator)
MTDPDLRAALELAHRDDAPPSFDATLARARASRPSPRRWIRATVFAATIAAAAVAIVWLVRPHDEPTGDRQLGMATTSLRMPLDSLLAIPDTDLLATTPHFDKGVLP